MIKVWWQGEWEMELGLCGRAACPWSWNHEAVELGGTSRGLGPARGPGSKGSCASVGIGQSTAA